MAGWAQRGRPREAPQGHAARLSGRRPDPCPGAPLRAAVATARRRKLLAPPPGARRSLGSGFGGSESRTRRLAMAVGIERRRWPRPNIPGSSRTVPRGSISRRTRHMLPLRPAGLPFRLASRSLGRRQDQPPRPMARVLRGGLEGLERSCRSRQIASPAAEATLRRNRAALVARSGGRPSHALASGLAQPTRSPLGRLAAVLGLPQSPGHQPRRSPHEVRRRSFASCGRSGGPRRLRPSSRHGCRVARPQWKIPLSRTCRPTSVEAVHEGGPTDRSPLCSCHWRRARV